MEHSGLKASSSILSVSSKVKGVVSLYDVTDDWIPIYDKSSLPGFYMEWN